MGQVDQSGIIKAVRARNVPDAYVTMIHAMRDVWQAKRENSRNGPVRVARNVYLEIENPMQRVLFDPVRNANPFFHVMEFVWMMSGSNDVRWIEQFNRRMREYADPGTDTHHGAYGHRWRVWHGLDQLIEIRNLLRRDPNTRRAVLSMWDGRSDLSEHNDLPCNTHIYLAIEEGRLNFTVCNRSNDLIWGMLGANAVHMTLLQELLAADLKVEVGSYCVYTNNLHVYENLPNFAEVWATQELWDFYPEEYDGLGFLGKYTLEDFLSQCETFVEEGYFEPTCDWLNGVATPMYEAWMARKKGEREWPWIRHISDFDWRMAATNWIERKELAKKARMG